MRPLDTSSTAATGIGGSRVSGEGDSKPRGHTLTLNANLNADPGMRIQTDRANRLNFSHFTIGCRTCVETDL